MVNASFTTGSVVKDTAGAYYLVVSRIMDPRTRAIARIGVESLTTVGRSEIVADALELLSPDEQIPDGWTVIERYVMKWVHAESRFAFRIFLDSFEGLTRRLDRPYGHLRPTTELDSAHRAFKNASVGSTVSRKDDQRDPHFPGSRRFYCVACGATLKKPLPGNHFPIHDACRRLITGRNNVRYCGYCGVRFTLDEFRNRWGVPARKFGRQIVCPEGEAVRRRNPW